MKILIADDHLIFRNGLREIVKSQISDCEIIEAENGAEAYKLSDKNKKGEIKEGLSKLTNVELKTLKLVSENLTSREIGEMLFVTQQDCRKLPFSYL